MGSVTITVQDNALGQVPAPTDNVALLIGVSSEGTAGEIYSFSDIRSVRETLGEGPLVEAAAHVLSRAGGTVRCCKVAATTDGAIGAVTASNAAAPELAAAASSAGGPHDTYAVVVRITKAGGRGAGVFRVSLDGGETELPAVVIPEDGVYEIPNTNVELTFGDEVEGTNEVQTITPTTVTAGTFILQFDGETTAPIAYNATAAAVQAALEALSTVGTGNVLCAGGPINAAPVSVTFRGDLAETDVPAISADGSILTGTIAVTTTTPGVAGEHYEAGDTFSFDTTEPLFDASGLASGFESVFADAAEWGFCHVVTRPATGAATRTLANGLDTHMTTAEETHKRYVFGIVDSADDTDANLEAAFLTFTSTRVGTGGGYVSITSPISGRVYSRPVTWPLVARLAAIPISEHPGRVRTGPLGGIADSERDERLASTKLAEERFNVVQTYQGKTGFFFTKGLLMAGEGSDFAAIQNRRVMDAACSAAHTTLLEYLNDSVRVNANGTILERDAVRIEDHVRAKLEEALVNPGDATAVSAQVSRATNIVSSGTMRLTLRVRPLGYAEDIEVDIGFETPSTVSA